MRRASRIADQADDERTQRRAEQARPDQDQARRHGLTALAGHEVRGAETPWQQEREGQHARQEQQDREPADGGEQARRRRRSEERRVGDECGSTWRYGWSPYP